MTEAELRAEVLDLRATEQGLRLTLRHTEVLLAQANERLIARGREVQELHRRLSRAQGAA